MALACSTQISPVPSAVTLRDAGMRLDVALVDRLGRVLCSTIDVGLGLKPASTSPWPNSMRLATLDGFVGLRLDAAR